MSGETDRSMYRGHKMALVDGAWRYADGVAVRDDPFRACGHCGSPNTADGHDGCLGTLPGVINACCGHGTVDDAYVVLEDGSQMDGANALLAVIKLLRDDADFWRQAWEDDYER